jgi:hypothetical protein
MNESGHDELAERMGVKRQWSRGYASKAVVYALFDWMSFVLSVPLDILARACSEGRPERRFPDEWVEYPTIPPSP